MKNSPTPRPVVAAAILDNLHEPTELLCAARAYPASLRGLFELPGGKVEPGESPRQALAREISEELGTCLEFGSEVRSTAGPWEILEGRTMQVWLAQVAPGAPAPHLSESHLELVWQPLDQVEDLPWLPTNQPIVTELKQLGFRQTHS